MAHAGPQILVLIVEDDAWQCMGASLMFSDAGYRVLEAQSADEAMTIFEDNLDIALLFTDVTMAGTMDGAELVRRVAARWPKVAIMVTSGLSRPDPLPSKARFHGKPYDSAEVLRHARELTTN